MGEDAKGSKAFSLSLPRQILRCFYTTDSNRVSFSFTLRMAGAIIKRSHTPKPIRRCNNLPVEHWRDLLEIRLPAPGNGNGGVGSGFEGRVLYGQFREGRMRRT